MSVSEAVRIPRSWSANKEELERADELAKALKRSRSDMFRILVDEKRVALGLDPAPSFFTDQIDSNHNSVDESHEPATAAA